MQRTSGGPGEREGIALTRRAGGRRATLTPPPVHVCEEADISWPKTMSSPR